MSLTFIVYADYEYCFNTKNSCATILDNYCPLSPILPQVGGIVFILDAIYGNNCHMYLHAPSDKEGIFFIIEIMYT